MNMSTLSPSLMFAAAKKKPAKDANKAASPAAKKATAKKPPAEKPTPAPIYVGVSGHGESGETIEKMKTLGREAGGFLRGLGLDVAEVTAMVNNANILITLGSQNDLEQATAALKAATDNFSHNHSSIRGDQFYSKTPGLTRWDVSLKTYAKAFDC